MSNITVRDCTRFINDNAGKLTRDDINEFIRAINNASRTLQNKARAQFRINDVVWFISRHGMKVTGLVRKINTSTIQVYAKDTNVTWRVSPGLLRLKSQENEANNESVPCDADETGLAVIEE